VLGHSYLAILKHENPKGVRVVSPKCASRIPASSGGIIITSSHFSAFYDDNLLNLKCLEVTILTFYKTFIFIFLPIYQIVKPKKNSARFFWKFLSIVILVHLLLGVNSGICHAAQVTLAWDANPDPIVAGYRLYHGVTSRTYGTPVDVGKLTRYTYTGIVEGITSYFAVTAYDANGNESAFSEELPCYTLVPTAGANGAISPGSTVVVSRGMSQTFTITPAAGFSVKDVLVDGVSAGAVTTYAFSNITACHRIAATFEIISNISKYTIAASAGANGSISPSGSVSVVKGASQVFMIKPGAHYAIKNVLVDGASIGAVTSYIFPNVQANHNIYASFTRVRRVKEAIQRSEIDSSNPLSESGIISGSGGWIDILTPRGEESALPVRIDWPEYNRLSGEMRIATGDIDGDGRDEIIVGLGRVKDAPGIPGGYFAVLGADLSLIAWGQVEWPEYNNSNGETRPACGDIDGDGIDEIIVGLGPGGEGRMEVFKFENFRLKHVKWLQAGWQDYNRGNGEMRPACGDLDGDGTDEVIAGLGPIRGNSDVPGGVFLVFDASSTGSAMLRDSSLSDVATWGRIGSPAYNRINGESWPACGDVNGDGQDEIILALGNEGAGRFEILRFDLSENSTQHLVWLQSTLQSALHPACGRLDADASDQIVIGSSMGIIEVFGDASRNYESVMKMRMTIDSRKSGGQIWPAVRNPAKERLLSTPAGIFP
jgi:hypothetical protein